MNGVGWGRVRPFIMTGGRTRAERRDLRVETLLASTGREVPEHLAHHPKSSSTLLRQAMKRRQRHERLFKERRQRQMPMHTFSCIHY